MEILRHTKSVCPVCLQQIPARKVRKSGGIFLEKKCPEHGAFSVVVWRDREDFEAWTGELPEVQKHENRHCPDGCGLCPDHRRDTCCVLLEVTDRCNLGCTYCFADNGHRQDPVLEEVKEWLQELAVPGQTLVQLSGGEPTVREDLPEIVAYAREIGCKYVQLNTNGLRLAEDPEYVRRLAEAGLSFVFLQFDGTDDRVWEKMRGRPLRAIKEQAIANCNACSIGVTLVPTLVPGVNIQEIGNILRYGVEHSPAVRGVHFQPVSFLGHMPAVPRDEIRFTLDELLEQIRKQFGEGVPAESLVPSACDHPLCGFHGDFIVMPEGTLMPLTKRHTLQAGCCCGAPAENPAEKNREFVGRRWLRRQEESDDKCCPEGQRGTDSEAAPDITSLDGFLDRAKSHGFTITAMAFQDAGTLDVERLRQCSLHVYRDGKHIPFCAYYLTAFPE